MRSTKIIYWICTTLIVLFEGVMPAFTFNTEMARQGTSHLGYPVYFGPALVAFKVAGAILLILPQVSRRWKEWAYAGFTFDFIFAFISHGAVDGLNNGETYFPLIVLAVLMGSYVCYHKLQASRISQGAKTPFQSTPAL